MKSTAPKNVWRKALATAAGRLEFDCTNSGAGKRLQIEERRSVANVAEAVLGNFALHAEDIGRLRGKDPAADAVGVVNSGEAVVEFYADEWRLRVAEVDEGTDCVTRNRCDALVEVVGSGVTGRKFTNAADAEVNLFQLATKRGCCGLGNGGSAYGN